MTSETVWLDQVEDGEIFAFGISNEALETAARMRPLSTRTDSRSRTSR